MRRDGMEGGCLCGALRYRITGAPIDAGYCHCRLCQRSSGAPVLAWVTVAVAQFAYTQGSPAVFRSSARAHREFCSGCGTQIVFRLAAGATTVDVTIPSLDEPATVVPEYHIWRAARIAWFETADHLPRHDDAGPDDR